MKAPHRPSGAWRIILTEEVVTMPTGEICEHYNPTESEGRGWWIQIQTPEGQYYGECTTEENWLLYDYNDQYETGINNVPCA